MGAYRPGGLPAPNPLPRRSAQAGTISCLPASVSHQLPAESRSTRPRLRRGQESSFRRPRPDPPGLLAIHLRARPGLVLPCSRRRRPDSAGDRDVPADQLAQLVGVPGRQVDLVSGGVYTEPDRLGSLAIAANLWITRRSLDDRRNERLWGDRAQLYLDLVRLVRREQDRQVRDVLMTIDGLDREPQSFWQSERDRDPRAWDDREIRVLTYASDRTRNPYYEWDLALLRLAGIIQPERVTGVARPADLPSVVEVAPLSESSCNGRCSAR